MTHMVRTSDGRDYEVDDHGNMRALDISMFVTGSHSNFSNVERPERIHDPFSVSPSSSTAINFVSDPISAFSPSVFTRVVNSYFEDDITHLSQNTRSIFNSIMRIYRRECRLVPRGSLITARVRMQPGGVWQYTPVPDRSVEQLADYPSDSLPSQQKPRYCLHDACIKCQGTRKIGGRRHCQHQFDCHCIKCAVAKEVD
jgi:hypothetical protein